MNFSIFYPHRGFSLIIVLWMLVVLTLIALVFTRQIRTEVQVSANFLNQAKAQALAESGIWRATMMILQKDITPSNQQMIYLDGRIYPLSSEVGKLEVSLQSVQGLVDLNRAPDKLIGNILRKVASESADSLAAALFDWRDEDDNPRVLGAEHAKYVASNMGYVPPNRPLVSVAELARIYGMTTPMYKALRPYVTVNSSDALIDISTAPLFVLSILPGISESDISSVLSARDTKLNNIDLAVLPTTTRQYVSTAKAHTIRLSSRAESGGVSAGVVAVVRLTGEAVAPINILSWHFQIDEVFTDNEA